jgi:hypothetical protein
LKLEFSPDGDVPPLKFNIRPAQMGRWLAVAAACLVLGHTFRFYYFNFTSHPFAYRLVQLFDLNAEQTPAAWFSSALLLICGLLTLLVALGMRQRRTAGRWRWFTVAGLLVLMSADEIAMLHELASTMIAERRPMGGFFNFEWVVLAVPLLLTALVVLGPMLRWLPRRLAGGLLLAAGVYFGGAVAVEMVGGKIADLHSTNHWMYFIAVTFEEGMEIAGLVLAVVALLRVCEWSAGAATAEEPERAAKPSIMTPEPLLGR